MRSSRFAYFGFCIEGPSAAPLPQRQYLADIVTACACSEIEQCAVEGSAIVVGQLDQAGFLDKATQLDQVTCSFASLHDPAPIVGSTFSRFGSQRRRLVQPERPICRP